MKHVKILLLILSVLTLTTVAAFAGEECTHGKAAAGTHKKADTHPAVQIAVYSVPDMTEEVAIKISQALKDNKGIAVAKPDFEKKQMTIFFKSEMTDQNKIKDAMASVVPETKLDSVRKAEEKDLKHNCGKCPSKKTCGKAKT